MKLYYSEQRQRYEVSEWTPQGRQLIDHDKDLWKLGLRQGFFCEDELELDFNQIEEDQEINDFAELDKLLISNVQQLITNN